MTGGHNLNIRGVYLCGLEGEGAYRNFDLSSICFLTLIMTCPLTSHKLAQLDRTVPLLYAKNANSAYIVFNLQRKG